MLNKTILFVGGPIDIGGAGKMLKFVANSCVADFNKVILYSIEQNQRPIDLHSKIEFLANPFKATNTFLWRIKTIIEIRKKVKKIRPDVICSFTSETSTWVRIATLGLPLLVSSAERGDPYTLPFLWKILVKWVFRHSDACFFQLESARAFYGVDSPKSYVIPNPFILPTEVPVYNSIRNKTIVGAGRFVIEKGFDVLIDAYSLVEKKHPDYRLVIWGDGPLLNDYKKQLEKYGILDKASFPGYSANVAESVRKEGVFVLSSRFEGIPNVLIEALSVGIPSVATNCSPGGPAFLLGDGDRGLIVPLEDSISMANAILKLIEDNNLYKDMEQRGPDIRKILDPKIISQKWIDAFTALLA